jgi:protein-disulfide isomerase
MEEPAMPRRLLICLLAALAILAAPRAGSQAAETLTPAQKDAFEKIVHDYILAHPEILIQALQSAEDKMKDEARGALVEKRKELVEDPTSPVGGNPKGDVTIVEFFDYRCPYCKQVEPSLEALLREDGHVRLVYKEFPILGKDSVFASRVALAAMKQGKYAAFHNAAMTAKGQLDEKTVLQIAAGAGLDVDKVKAEMNSPEVDDIIKRTHALAQALDIRGTPAFIIGDEMLPGAVDLATLKQKIAAARKAG